MSCHTTPFEAKDGDVTEESAPIIRNLITSEDKSPTFFEGISLQGQFTF